MYNKFVLHIKQNFPELFTKKVVVAVSGGLDSVTLLHLLKKVGCDVAVAHCNFKLRGEDSDLDEKLVGAIGEKLQVSTWVKSFETKQIATQNKKSIQETARDLRYEWFAELLSENKAHLLVTAHNLDDNFETVLHHLTRGTGLKGLVGIPQKTSTIYRPLLNFSREEIERYAKVNQLIWREDQSNTQTKYTRNKIRHKVIPVLKEINPNLLESFKKTQQHVMDSNLVLQNMVAKKWQKIHIKENDIIKIKIDKLKQLVPLSFYLYEFFKPYGFTAFNDILDLLDAQSGKQIFSSTHRLIKDRNFLLLQQVNQKLKENTYKIPDFKSKITVKLPNINLFFTEEIFDNQADKSNKKTIPIDKDLLKFPLQVRKWQKGDYFYPTGMKGKKKLSNYFKDEKLSLIEKENIWLLLSEEKIVWIIGMRQDRRFIAKAETKKSLIISVNNDSVKSI